MSPQFSPLTYLTAYAPFTPSDSGQRSPPTYYRGCWHVVSRGFFCRYSLVSSLLKAVYDPRAFVPHAASLRQGSPHCARFPTAASRRSLGRVSVPIWPVGLSTRLPVVGTVGRHPAVYLMGRGAIPSRRGFSRGAMRHPGVSGITRPFGRLSRGRGQVLHVLLSRSPLASLRRGVPFDLHVLGAPPAFILSQDRTLRPKCMGFEPVRSSQLLADRFRSIHMVLV